jgi:hypothetical protein
MNQFEIELLNDPGRLSYMHSLLINLWLTVPI